MNIIDQAKENNLELLKRAVNTIVHGLVSEAQDYLKEQSGPGVGGHCEIRYILTCLNQKNRSFKISRICILENFEIINSITLN